MAKELIISANVHEKKVAMLEDGMVTEFYVERRDENQGVVGNLYKGRVMKVLPGMQSAFVDIGLERDAFLYVSDFTEFMEEEDEIDFKEATEQARAEVRPARAEPRPRRDDRHRREPVSASTRSVARRVSEEEAEPVPIDDVVEQLAEIADERVIEPPEPEEDTDEMVAVRVGDEIEISEAEVAPIESLLEERVTEQRVKPHVEIPSWPALEKISDEDQAASEAELAEAEEAKVKEKPKRSRSRKKPGETAARKTTTRSTKKTTKPKAEAAPAEPGKRKTSTKSTTKRSSRRRGEKVEVEEAELAGTAGARQAQQLSTAASFERVTDEDLEQETGELLKDAIVQEKITEQIHNAEYQTTPFQPEPEPEWRVGSLRSKLTAASEFQRVSDDAPAQDASENSDIKAGLAETATAEEKPSSSFRHISDVIPGDVYSRAAESTETASEISEVSGIAASGSEESPSDEQTATAQAENSIASSEDQEESSDSVDEDREAALREQRGRAEFAVRRGGRGRRRRREPPPGAQATASEEEKNGAAPAAEEPGAESAEPSKSEDASRATGLRQPEPRRDRRPEPQRRVEAAPRRPDRSATTISELLHEGQEILVQIAKEPIAKKGARITSHIALPGRYLVYMPTVNHVGVSRKIASEVERVRLKRLVSALREREAGTGGFIARTACAGHTEQELLDDMRYLLRTWADIRKKADRVKAPSLVHRDLDLIQRILRDQLSDEFSAIRVDSETEYARIVEFVNRVQPKLVNRVKLHTGNQPILEKYGVQPEIDKAVRPRVWLKSGGYIVINQTEALVAIDVNTGKFVGKSDKLEDTITRTNLEAAKEIVRQVRLRDLGGIIVIDFIDMEERKNRQRVMLALQQELQHDRAPSKILSINDFGLVAITRKRVKQSLERTLCTPCPYCQGAGMVKSAQTVCFEILAQSKALTDQVTSNSDVMLRVSEQVAEAFRTTEHEVFEEIEAYLGTPVTIEADPSLHQEQFDFAIL